MLHGKQYFLANYEWNEEMGTGDFTYVDRITGEASQEQREQRKHWLTPSQRLIAERERAAEAEKEARRQERRNQFRPVSSKGAQ